MMGTRDLCVLLFLLGTCLREAAAARSGTTTHVRHDTIVDMRTRAAVVGAGERGGGKASGKASVTEYSSCLMIKDKDETAPVLREAPAYTPRWVANPDASSRRSEGGLWITHAELHVKLLHLVAPLRFSAEELEGMTVQKERHNDEGENEESSHSEHHDTTKKLYFSYWGRVYSPATSSSSTPSAVWLHDYVPGPTINVMPGGLLNLTIVNDLIDDEEESPHTAASSDEKRGGEGKEKTGSVGGKSKRGEEKGEENVRLFNCAAENANTTNVHFHGMHVDPRIDDPFINIYPTTRMAANTNKEKDKKGGRVHLLAPRSNIHRYELPIPASHVEGLHWYHAHRHGATYHHVMSGMFGAMTVLGLDSPSSLTEKVNEDNKEKVKQEHILVFQFIRLRAFDPVRDAHGYRSCTSKPLAEADEEIKSLVPTSPNVHWYSPPLSTGVDTNESTNTIPLAHSSEKSVHADRGASAAHSSSESSQLSSPPSLSLLKHAEHIKLPPTLYFVNGQHRPVLEVTEGTPTRLRMVFAAGSCYLNMSFVPQREGERESGAGCVFVSEGVDGVPLRYASSQTQPDSDEKKRQNEERDNRQWLYFTTATRHEITLMCWAAADEGNEGKREGSNSNKVGDTSPSGGRQNDADTELDVVHEGIVLMSLRVVRSIRKYQMSRKETNTVAGGGPTSRVVVATREEKAEEGYSTRLTPSQLRYYLSASKGRKRGHGVAVAGEGPRQVVLQEGGEKSTTTTTDNRALVTAGTPHYLDLTTTAPTGSKGGKEGMTAVLPNTNTPAVHVFKWDVSFSQMPVTRSRTFVSTRKRPFYIIGSGANCTLAAESVVLDINSEQESYSVDGSLTASSWSPEICAGASASSSFNSSSFSASHCLSRCDFVAFDGHRGDWWSHYQATIDEKSSTSPPPPPTHKKNGGRGDNVKETLVEREKEEGKEKKGGYHRHSKFKRELSGTENEDVDDASVATLHSLKQRYKDFVVPFDSIVELKIFGDPTDLTPHPFHAHVSHFRFISFTPRAVSPDSSPSPALPPRSLLTPADYGIYPGEWRDTIPILDGETVVQWRAATYDGEIVYHCHALTHEDKGMMTSYVVLPKSVNVSGLLDDEGGAGPLGSQEGSAYSRVVKFFEDLLGNASLFTSTPDHKSALLIGITCGAIAAVTATVFALYRRYKRNQILDLPGGNTRRRYVGIGSSRRSTNNWYSRGDDFEGDDTNSIDVEESGSGGRMEELTPVAGALRAVATYEVPSYGTL